MDDNTLMEYCLSLAEAGWPNVSPNPCVGAFIVHNDQIVKEGWHQSFGSAHAERHAITALNDNERKLLPESTLFVSLEPCNHHGKTPPCTDLIIESGIRRIVVGYSDPNPLMCGRSLQCLRDAGIEVIGPLFDDFATYPKGEVFMTGINQKRPYIILKWAQSMDNYLSIKEQCTKITNFETNVLVHKWRAESNAILIGYKTLITDQPQLTTRYWTGKNPVRYVLKDHRETNIIYEGFRVLLDEDLAHELTKMYIMNNIGILMVEGGAYTLNKFIDKGVWDECRVITNKNMYIQNGVPAPNIQGILKDEYTLGNNHISIIRPSK